MNKEKLEVQKRPSVNTRIQMRLLAIFLFMTFCITYYLGASFWLKTVFFANVIVWAIGEIAYIVLLSILFMHLFIQIRDRYILWKTPEKGWFMQNIKEAGE